MLQDFRRPTRAAMLLGVLLLTGCAKPRTELVSAACPQPPIVPAALKTLPAEATLDWEALILKQFNGSAP